MRSAGLVAALCLVVCASACGDAEIEVSSPSRAESIPTDAVKVTPETDSYPPVLHSEEYESPVPMPGAINTAGAEDSPFIVPDGSAFYFFFTPDVSVPAEQQVGDGVTGIYVSQRTEQGWAEPERVRLQDPGKAALDGAPTVVGDTMYFASAREGYTGVHWFTATDDGGEWTDWSYADDLNALDVGEMHIVGDDLFFHSDRPGGVGGLDIWMATREGSAWGQPVNLGAVNTEADEGWPYVTEDGAELWLTRTYGGAPSLWRSQKVGGEWREPELMVDTFAGEASLDGDGNLYFVHHYYDGGEMIEADIYVCYRK